MVARFAQSLMTDDVPDQGGEPTQDDFDAWFESGAAAPRVAPPPPHWLDPLAIVAAVLAVVVIVGMVMLWPNGERQDQYRDQVRVLGIPSESFAARVDEVVREPCSFDPSSDCVTVFFELLQGPDEGAIFTQTFSDSASIPDFRVGEEEILGYLPDAEDFAFRYQFEDRQRRGVIVWVLVAFALAVIALGRAKGIAALVALVGTLAIMLSFVLPAILDGRSPVLVAIVGASAVAFLALYVSHGFRRMTTVALLGMLASLALTALLSMLVLAAARISGFATEESILLSLFEGIDIRGLVLAGTVLGAAGALDDVTVTQASAVWELRAANPTLDAPALFRSGLRIGRDHIASTVNTLMLAYVGAALPLLVLFVVSGQSLTAIANSEVVAIEILRTLIGSIGLVAAVPLTTWLAARTASRQPVR